MIPKKPLYTLDSCFLGGIEGQGWSRYESKGFTHNLIGSVFFEPDQYQNVKAIFEGSQPIIYEGPVYEDGSVTNRKALVSLEQLSQNSDDSPGQLRRPFIEGHVRVEFLGPGNPFV